MPVKIAYNKNVHMYHSQLKSYAELAQFIEKSFSDLPKNFELYYEDSDGDIITISNDEDIKVIADAKNIKLHVREAPKSTQDEFQVISSKIEQNINAKLEQKKQDSPHHSKAKCSKEGWKAWKECNKEERRKKRKQMVREIVKEELYELLPEIISVVQLNLQGGVPQPPPRSNPIPPPSNSKVVHHGYVCDGCDGPIIGNRFKCTVCQDYDYCEKCEATKEHAHAFLKITDPKKCPAAVLTAVAEDEETAKFVKTGLENVGCMFREILGSIPTNIQCPKKQGTSKPQPNPPQPSKLAVEIASIVGGDAFEYEVYVQNCAGLELDEIVEAVMADRDTARSSIKPSTSPKVSQTVTFAETPTSEGSNCSERGRKSSPKSSTKPVVSKKYSWTEENRAQELIEFLGGNMDELEYYCEIVRANPQTPNHALIEDIMIEQSFYSQKNLETGTVEVVEKKEEKQVETEVKVEQKEEKREIKTENTIPVPSPEVINRAMSILTIMGGCSEDDLNFYIKTVDKFRNISDEEIIEDLLQEFSQTRAIPKKSEVRVEKIEEVPEIKPEIKVEPVVVKKFRKDYSSVTKEKAEQVSQVLGGDAADFYGVCDTFPNTNVNDIIEMILSDETNLVKYSSYI